MLMANNEAVSQWCRTCSFNLFYTGKQYQFQTTVYSWLRTLYFTAILQYVSFILIFI